MEDSKNALFVEPNAYIYKFNNESNKKIKKVVFREPYENAPNFYFDNHFHKGNCDCVPNKNEKDCNKYDKCNSHHDCNCNQNKSNFGFDIKSLMPILNSFNKGGMSGLDINSLSSLFGLGGGLDFQKLLSNPQLITSVLSMFGGKKKTNVKKEEIVCTDYEIKKYTKVE